MAEKTIHSFYNPGNFVTDAGFNETIEWVTVGGGGGGGGTITVVVSSMVQEVVVLEVLIQI